jgi:hypothetical protein
VRPGALVLALLAAILPILGLPQSALETVYGCVILVAVSVSSGKLGARKQSE